MQALLDPMHNFKKLSCCISHIVKHRSPIERRVQLISATLFVPCIHHVGVLYIECVPHIALHSVAHQNSISLQVRNTLLDKLLIHSCLSVFQTFRMPPAPADLNHTPDLSLKKTRSIQFRLEDAVNHFNFREEKCHEDPDSFHCHLFPSDLVKLYYFSLLYAKFVPADQIVLGFGLFILN